VLVVVSAFSGIEGVETESAEAPPAMVAAKIVAVVARRAFGEALVDQPVISSYSD
jgi:hypothetical protein